MEIFYTEKEQRELLKLARESIEYYLENRVKLQPDRPENEKYLKKRAVFVTLNIGERLRGCIGQLEATEELYHAIAHSAYAAAFSDPRFNSLHRSEVNDIKIEISILSPLKKISDIKEIEMKKHGVYIKQGFKTGVYLPQVAEETGWDKKRFLESLCYSKAGLPADAYKDEKTELFIFRVTKFHE